MRLARECVRRSGVLGLVTIGLGIGPILAKPLHAQFNEVPPPAAYAIQGVTVVRPDGSRLEGVTIVIRGHAIEAIGQEIAIPEDAEILPGDSLMVYPGLFDAEGEAGYEFPETDFEGQQIMSWDPPRERQGFLPERRVVDHLTDTGKDLEAARKKGVVAAAVHPSNALMPGQGSLLLFRKSADVPRHLVIHPSVGIVMAFRGGRGVYPSQLFGVIAFFRQQFEDASRRAAWTSAFASDPRGLPMPAWDPAAEVLQGAMQGAMPVFFRADGAQDIRRALGLADEFGFRPIIVGGDEAWKVMGELVRRDVPVLVSVAFPSPDRWEPEESEPEESEPTEPETAEPTEETAEPTEEPEEPTEPETEPPAGETSVPQEAQETSDEPEEPAAWREKKRLEEMYANAGLLAEAGVRFALTSGGGSGDLLEGTRKAIEYGLSEADALRALTSTPAEILGAPYLARVEEGYPANLVVTDGPLFEEETKLLFTFVEGELERTGADAADPTEAATVDLTGEWKIEIEAEGLSISGTMSIQQDGSSFTGSMDLDVGAASIRDGVVSGNTMTAQVIPEGDDGVTMTGTVEGDRITGRGTQGEFSFTFTATRTPGGAG